MLVTGRFFERTHDIVDKIDREAEIDQSNTKERLTASSEAQACRRTSHDVEPEYRNDDTERGRYCGLHHHQRSVTPRTRQTKLGK